MRKKIIKVLLIIVLTFPYLIPYSVEAKTLGDLENQLKNLQTEENSNINNIKQTEQEIQNTKNKIESIYNDIDNINLEIVQKTKEIENLTEKIAQKDEEIKKLMNFLQVSSGEIAYLEYIFGAKSLTDFIYRLSVTEQLSRYNKEMIGQMNNMIKENVARKEALAIKEQELNNLQSSLIGQLDKLGDRKSDLYEENRDIKDEIANALAVVDMYRKAGCKTNDDINVCANKLLPPDTRFFRPMEKGYVTSEYGGRKHPVTGVYAFHSGIDLSYTTKANTRIYPVANGKVAKVFYDKYGGNQVVVHHNINGKGYTSAYHHLSVVMVKDGDVLSRETVVGMMGTTGLSTGVHLHLTIATGLRYKDYISYNDYTTHWINPRSVINFPTGGVWWADRITKYN